MKDTLTGLKGTPAKHVYLNGHVPLKECPKCGELMSKYYILNGRERLECSCGYKEEI